MAAPVETRKMTIEEFYAWAELQEEPYELVDGEPVPLYPETDESGVVRAMAAGTADHHHIQFNAGRAIDRRTPMGCVVATGGRVRTVESRGRELDVLLSCGPREKGAKDFPDPVLIVEVLSPTTAHRDRGEKLDEYRELPSVREIWLVDSERRHAQVWRRREGGWFVTDTIGQRTFRSDALTADIPLDELYRDTPV